jgi:hypothetical protein
VICIFIPIIPSLIAKPMPYTIHPITLIFQMIFSCFIHKVQLSFSVWDAIGKFTIIYTKPREIICLFALFFTGPIEFEYLIGFIYMKNVVSKIKDASAMDS